MSPRISGNPGVEAQPGEITAEEVLDEFLQVMHEWGREHGFRAFACPASAGICHGVELPGPDMLQDRARQASQLARLHRAGRI